MMKKKALKWLLPALLLPVSAVAQINLWNLGEMSQDDIQSILGQVQSGLMAAQRCLAQQDPNELQDIQRRGEAFSNEVLQACQAGDLETAKFLVMTKGRKLYESEAVTELQACFAEAEATQALMRLLPNMDYWTLMAGGAQVCGGLGGMSPQQPASQP